MSVIICLSASTAAWAQTAASAPEAAKPEDESVVELGTFEIQEKQENPYVSRQALSTSRVAMAIEDIPQTVSIVTSELILDTGANRMLDAAKYVTPIVESSLPYGGDRYHVRGFQVSAEFIDGSIISGQDGYSMSLAPYNIERVEVIKGPNAILVPGGSPGGVMNPITKAPVFRDQASMTLEVSTSLGSNVNFDVNRSMGDDKAVRLVAAYWDADGWIERQYRRGWMLAPSFAWQLNEKNKLIIKSEFMENKETNLGGVPIDPLVGSNQNARVAPGIPKDWSFAGEDDTRRRISERGSIELLSNFSDNIKARFYLMGDHITRDDVGGSGVSILNLNGTSGLGGTRNPYTGVWEPGVNWTVTYDTVNPSLITSITSAPLVLPTAANYILRRNPGRVYLEYTEAHFKNDYAINFATDLFKSQTIAGFAANYSKVHFYGYPARSPSSRPDIPIAQLKYATYGKWIFGAPRNTDKTGVQEDVQLFVYERLSFLDDKLAISGGISNFNGSLERTDTTGIGAIVDPKLDANSNDYSFGAVAKVVKGVSLFYGYNSTGGALPGSLAAGNFADPFRVSVGEQNEVGIKTSWLKDKLTASVAFFDIAQDNYPVPNSLWYIDNTLPSTLYLDLTSKGWEFEMQWAVNNSITILGNYADFEMRQPLDVKYRAVPDQNAGLYVSYQCHEGPATGWGLNIGADYKGRSAGDQVAPGYTTRGPLPGGGEEFVANQPSFMVAARTIFNVGASYRNENYTVRLNCMNALDEDYILGAGSRNALVVGDGRTYKFSVTRRF